MSECTPTEADREDAKLFLIGLSLDGTDETPQSLPAEGVDDIVAELAALFAKVRADERAKRPDREQIERTVRAHRVWWNFETGSLCQCGWKCLLSEHPAHVADAVLSSLALKTETDQELQDRIEVLEKNLAYEVAQKIKLADTLRDERAKRPDRDRYVSEAHRRYSGSGNHPGGERHAFLAGVDAVLSSLEGGRDV